MPKKKKKSTKGGSASGGKKIRTKTIKIIEPEMILEREIAEEDQDLRKAKVAEFLEGFRNDREKRREELKRFMSDLKMQRIKRREEMLAWRTSRQKFMQGLRSKILDKKKMMPEVRV